MRGIPAVRLYPKLVEAVRRLYDSFGSEAAVDLERVAQVLGHKGARSGTFMLKLTSLKSFGLVEGRGRIRVTELGFRLAYPRSHREYLEAYERAVRNIPLWRQLLDQFGLELPSDGKVVELVRQATGLGLREVTARLEEVRQYFLQDTEPLRRARAEPEGQVQPTGEVGLEEIRMGHIRLVLKPTLEDVAMARKLLDLFEGRIRERRARG
jgi:hypothetical protein